ncbi:MAG: hypothetical protein O2856_08725, partial [Planctomycetota bacterium]|nr:hypothetical protein [Planctomycetota bacterium]
LHAINPISQNWRQQLQLLDIEAQPEFYQHFSKRWHEELDACHGACVLRDRSIAETVSNSLHKFDGDRYELTDFIIMPNHVHLLTTFPVENLSDLDRAESQLPIWRAEIANQINFKKH